MAFTYNTLNSTQNILTAAEDLGVVTSSGSIVNTAICVLMSGEAARLINDGLVASGNIAVSASNDVQIVNSGRIFGELQAISISISGIDVTTSVIFNSGEITSYTGTAISCVDAGLRLTNTGTITGTSVGVNLSGTNSTVVNVINNAGTIAVNGASPANAVSVSGVLQFTNTGVVIGNVALGVGSDTLDNRLGEIAGNVAMGNGSNLFLGGDTDESVVAGSGADTLHGGAGDDSLTGGTGNDRVAGGDGDDVLNGGLNDDTLRGGNGDDTLIGGGTVDVMSGGRGSDAFVFELVTDSDTLQAPDLIEGFSKKEDYIDLSLLSATPFLFTGTDPLAGGGAASVGYTQNLASLTISADVTGDGVADFVILLTGTTSLSQANFIL